MLLDDLQTPGLDGRYAGIIVPANKKDRFGVRVQGGTAVELIKRINVEPIGDGDTVGVRRMAAKGEEQFIGSHMQDTRWPLAVLDAMPYAISPVSVLLGFPLRVTRVQARSELSDHADTIVY